MKFSYARTSGLTLPTIKKSLQRVAPALKNVMQQQFAQQPSDQATIDEVVALVAQKQKLKPTLIVLVGIGGSSLGTLAIHEALAVATVPFLCADTVDSAVTEDIYRVVEDELRQGGRVLLIVVSKSGTTTETLVNAALLVDLIKTYHAKKYQEYVVVITDKNSALWKVAEKQSYAKLAVPTALGGRFSVFSAVGLFPLAMVGVDIAALCAGARAAQDDCLQKDVKNPAAVSAAILYEQYQAGKHIHDTFLFAPYLAQLGAWYRQLMGESIGKRYDLKGKEVLVGMTPTVSVGSNDLHSVAQLYLAGPYDKVTTFVSVAGKANITVPRNEFSALGTVGVGKSISVVQDAIFAGTCAAYKKDKRPFMTIELADYSAYEIGYYMQMKMCEIVYLGSLLSINVFDQPQVELYKKETRALLGK